MWGGFDTDNVIYMKLNPSYYLFTKSNAHTHIRAHTHTHTRAHTYTHTHTHKPDHMTSGQTYTIVYVYI